MTSAEMIGTSVMSDVPMDTVPTTVGTTIVGSVTPTGDVMIVTSETKIVAEMIGVPVTTVGDGTIGTSGMTSGVDNS